MMFHLSTYWTVFWSHFKGRKRYFDFCVIIVRFSYNFIFFLFVGAMKGAGLKNLGP